MAKITFSASLNDREHMLEVEKDESCDGRYTVHLNGETHVLDARFMPSEIASILIKNKSYDVDLDRSGYTPDPLDGHLLVHVRGRVIHLERSVRRCRAR